MSNVLIGIMAVVLFIGVALAGVLFLGDRFSNAANDAEASRYINEGQQISRAFELFGLEEGKLPDGSGESNPDETRRIIGQLVTKGYLKSAPTGTTKSAANWYVDAEKGAAMTVIGTGPKSRSVCLSARRQAGFNDEVKQCTDPSIMDKDPCCIE